MLDGQAYEAVIFLILPPRVKRSFLLLDYMKAKQILIHYELKSHRKKNQKTKRWKMREKKIRGIVQETNRIIRLS